MLMCLVTRLVKAIKASKDIICYKIYVPSDINDTFVSPYQGYKMPRLGKRVQTEFNNKINIASRLYNGESYIELGFHSYKNLEDIETLQGVIIAECTIPKGTKYYKGMFGTKESYCSECIILNKVIS